MWCGVLWGFVCCEQPSTHVCMSLHAAVNLCALTHTHIIHPSYTHHTPTIHPSYIHHSPNTHTHTQTYHQDGLEIPPGVVSGLYPSPLTVVAFTNCDLYALPALEFRELMEAFPRFRAKLQELSLLYVVWCGVVSLWHWFSFVCILLVCVGVYVGACWWALVCVRVRGWTGGCDACMYMYAIVCTCIVCMQVETHLTTSTHPLPPTQALAAYT